MGFGRLTNFLHWRLALRELSAEPLDRELRFIIRPTGPAIGRQDFGCQLRVDCPKRSHLFKQHA
jgi:hypothetical protein